MSLIRSTSFGFAQNTIHDFNQSVENTGAAFVQGADETNEFFEKVNKQ